MIRHKKIMCWLLGHNWTCRSLQGLGREDCDQPLNSDTPEQVMAKFRHSARMWCKRCGHVYKGGALL